MMRSLSVVHLGKYYPPAPGGIETHVQALARAQARLGAEVQVLCVNHLDERGVDVTWSRTTRTRVRRERDQGVELVRLARWGNAARLDICPGLGPLLLSAARRADVLHLHVPNPTMMLPLLLLPPFARARWVVTHHSDVVRQRWLGRAIRPLEHAVYLRADALIATSPPYAESSPLLSRHRRKVRVVPLGIDLAPFVEPSSAARREAERLVGTHGAPLWLVVGRLVYYKGIATALEALRDVPGTLLVVGEGPLGDELRDQAARLGVAERVVWLGHVSEAELVGAYLAASALWFSSNARSEAFGLAQVEAMAAGCPVINTSIPGSGVPWIAPGGSAALTVGVGDAVGLAAAARRLLDDPRLRARLVEAARARALAECSDRVAAERSLALYRELLAASR